MIYVLLAVCLYGQCEPYIVHKEINDYYFHIDYEQRDAKRTDEWCKTSLAEYHLRDLSLTTPETKDIYYLDPRLIGFQGATYDPTTAVCWPLKKVGPQ
jgi:hypothetical protein